jgi:hypothetical protein
MTGLTPALGEPHLSRKETFAGDALEANPSPLIPAKAGTQ